MDERFSRPKRFGEILDLTFSLSKSRFKDFFIISLIFFGPIYLLQALILFASGVSFFRQLGEGSVWYEQIISGFDDPESIDLASSLASGFVGLIGFFLFPVAAAAILLAVSKISKNEEYTISMVIKQAFSRYFPIIGSKVLFSIIMFSIIFIPILIIMIPFFIGISIAPTASIIISILLFLAMAIGIGYLLTRWSFYFGSVVLGEGAPGLGRSWRLTHKRAWKLMGLYIVFFLIISVISVGIELSFGIFLGNSVLFTMIASFASIFTQFILYVGFAVMYLDLKVRHDADDLKEMIDNYHVTQS